MDISPAQVGELIRKRRSIFPSTYLDKPIEKAIISDVLENANWAPTHKMTEPWRFRVLTGAARWRFGGFLSNWYAEHTAAEKFSEAKFKKLRDNPAKAGCIIAICMKRDPAQSLPEWEEIAAVACAVQNMYLTCAAHGIGCYWSTPEPALRADEFLGLQAGERCLGLFYMGHHEMPEVPGKRGPVTEKTVWITA